MGALSFIPIDSMGGVLRIRVAGDFDQAAGLTMRQHLVARLCDPEVTAVVVDLGRASRLNSGGIVALVCAKRSADDCGKTLRVDGARGQVARVLAATGLTLLLVDDAVDDGGSGPTGRDAVSSW